MINQFELLITLVMLSKLITMTVISVFGKAWIWNKFILIESLGEISRTAIYRRIYKLGM